ncbi:MAG: 1,4-alpha-glucan branching enzyme, partial [Actinobacteria bacterium]|nr:1,4-alpha-glucan branching enzyme [Actinomycetota bacterium]
ARVHGGQASVAVGDLVDRLGEEPVDVHSQSVDRAPGDYWQRQATLRAYLGFMWAHPGKKLLFMGSEFGQWTEWSAEGGLDWWLAGWDDHRGIADCVRDMNALYRATPALWELDNEPAGFEWLVSDAADDNTIAWLRKDSHGGVIAAVSNFSPVVRDGYRIGLPCAGTWREVLNTDSAVYGGGTNVGNYGAVHAESVGHHGRQASALITVPPLATVWFKPE